MDFIFMGILEELGGICKVYHVYHLFLRVNIVGVPNAGKSTLINALVGSNVCAASSKVQTTIRNSLAVFTKDDTQIIFQDTPGIVTEEETRKFKLSVRNIYIYFTYYFVNN